MTPTYHTMTVRRHARIGIVGDPALATEAWLILHGHGMLARGILHWFAQGEAPHRLLVAPESPSRFYTELSGGKRAVGASWVTREGLEDDLEDVFDPVEQVVREYVPEQMPLHVHGFSQGVSVGARWAIRSGRPVARLVGWAGSMPDDVSGRALLGKLGAEPLHLVVGDRDDRVPPDRVAADAARLESEGLAVRIHHFPGGHRVDNEVLAALEAIPVAGRRS